jgi:hypothetical protein
MTSSPPAKYLVPVGLVDSFIGFTGISFSWMKRPSDIFAEEHRKLG